MRGVYLIRQSVPERIAQIGALSGYQQSRLFHIILIPKRRHPRHLSGQRGIPRLHTVPDGIEYKAITAEHIAQPHPRHTEKLRKRAQDNQSGKSSHHTFHAVILFIRQKGQKTLVHTEPCSCCFALCRNAKQQGLIRHLSGGIIGIADKYNIRILLNGRQNGIRRPEAVSFFEVHKLRLAAHCLNRPCILLKGGRQRKALFRFYRKAESVNQFRGTVSQQYIFPMYLLPYRQLPAKLLSAVIGILP